MTLTYQIDNEDDHHYLINVSKNKSILKNLKEKIQLEDQSLFIINDSTIEPKTKINDILSKHANCLIKIYRPQTFKYKTKEKKIQFPINIKISGLKQELKKVFGIKNSDRIDLSVESNEDGNHDKNQTLNPIFNNGLRSFFKYIKPNLIFTVKINDSENIVDEYNYTTSAGSTENNHHKPKNTTNETNENLNTNLDISSKAKSTKQKPQPLEPLDIISKSKSAKSFLKRKYTANYRINNGDIKSISFSEDKVNSIYDVFSDLFPDISETDLIFVLEDDFQMLKSQKLVKEIFPETSTILIFTPITFTFRQNELKIPFKFKSTINEMKSIVKDKFNIKQRKNIIFSIRDKPELTEDLNKPSRHLIKFIKPDMIIDIIIDEFRFILIDDVHEYNDGKNEEKVFVRIKETAREFIEEFRRSNNIERKDGYIFCLRLSEDRYILHDSILSEFNSETRDGEMLKIQIIRQSINTIIINNKRYKYAFNGCFEKIHRPNVAECKQFILYNYYFGRKNINLDDIYFSVPDSGLVDNQLNAHYYHKKVMTLQIGYRFTNRKDRTYYFPLETTVGQAIETEGWTEMKITRTNQKIDHSFNLFLNCYQKKILAVREIQLYFNVNGHHISNKLSDSFTFSTIKEMIKNDNKLLKKLNKENNSDEPSIDFLLFFNDKEIPDELTVKSIHCSKENPIEVKLRPTYTISFEYNNRKEPYKKNFEHGTKISEISSFFKKKFSRRCKILSRSIELNDDDLIQNYKDLKLTVRMAKPLYSFKIENLNNKPVKLELREEITALEAKFSLMLELKINVPDHYFISLKNLKENIVYNDSDPLPINKEINVDWNIMKKVFAFVLPNLKNLYFRLNGQNENENKKVNENDEEEENKKVNENDDDDDDGENEKVNENDKHFINVPESVTFYHIKKIIQEKCKKKQFDVKFYYHNRIKEEKVRVSETEEDVNINEVKCNGKLKDIRTSDKQLNTIKVKFVKKRVFFYLRSKQKRIKNNNNNNNDSDNDNDNDNDNNINNKNKNNNNDDIDDDNNNNDDIDDDNNNDDGDANNNDKDTDNAANKYNRHNDKDTDNAANRNNRHNDNEENGNEILNKREFEVYLDELVNSYKEKLLDDKVTNVNRIIIKSKNNEIVNDERFEDFESGFEFYYEIESDEEFNLFDRPMKEFNNQFPTETKIKAIRELIEDRCTSKNIILKAANRILTNDTCLYEISEKVTYEINTKKVDDFDIHFMDCHSFRKVQPSLHRTFAFTSNTTVGELRRLLQDILAYDKFSIVFQKKFLNDNDERLFALGTKFFVVDGIKSGVGKTEPVLFELKGNKRFVVELTLSMSFDDAIDNLIIEKVVDKSVDKNDVKILFLGRFYGLNQKIEDALVSKHDYVESDSNNDDAKRKSFNKYPIYIYY